MKKRLSNVLSKTVVDIFHALNEFGKNNNKDEVAIYLLDDQLKWLKKVRVECIKYTFS